MNKHHVLIVDDQPANVQVMAEVLRDQYELYFATSGKKALEIAAGGNIELILLDVVMPDLDGFEVCRRLKSDEKTSRIPVIFVTAREEIEDETKGFNVGGVDYITKPIRPPVVRSRVATHLELKDTRDLLEQLASLDPLTGIANRRRFDMVLEKEWQRAVRGKHTISLAILDVDYFKKFNDTYGHARGDDCLRALGGAFSEVARRPGDLVARYGGEEFAMIFPDTIADGMRAIMIALLERVAELRMQHSASLCSAQVTVSAGAISIQPNADLPAIAGLEMADHLLYEVKEHGRNHCVHLDSMTNTKQRLGLLQQADQ